MRLGIVMLLMGLVLAAPVRAGETRLTDPPPDWDNPRKVVLQLSTDEASRVDSLLYNAVNIQKFYGPDMVKIVVVAFGPGVRTLIKGDSPVAERVESLMMYDIEFVACRNTLDTIGVSTDGLIDGVDWVQAGIPEIIERNLRGWVVIRP